MIAVPSDCCILALGGTLSVWLWDFSLNRSCCAIHKCTTKKREVSDRKQSSVWYGKKVKLSAPFGNAHPHGQPCLKVLYTQLFSLTSIVILAYSNRLCYRLSFFCHRGKRNLYVRVIRRSNVYADISLTLIIFQSISEYLLPTLSWRLSKCSITTLLELIQIHE
jgi:hypothetical protein